MKAMITTEGRLHLKRTNDQWIPQICPHKGSYCSHICPLFNVEKETIEKATQITVTGCGFKFVVTAEDFTDKRAQ